MMSVMRAPVVVEQISSLEVVPRFRSGPSEARRSEQVIRAAVQVDIEEVLDAGLPDIHDRALFRRNAQVLFQHVLTSYEGNGKSVYEAAGVRPASGRARRSAPGVVATVFQRCDARTCLPRLAGSNHHPQIS